MGSVSSQHWISDIKPNKVNIRIANEDDINFIVQSNLSMAKETENKTLDKQIVQAGVRVVFQKDNHDLYLIAEEARLSVGQLLITKEWSDWRNGYFWWIQSVYVHPEHRCKGVYKNLHKTVRQLAKEQNACGIRLYVDSDNNIAQKTYRSLGMDPSNYIFFEEDWSDS